MIRSRFDTLARTSIVALALALVPAFGIAAGATSGAAATCPTSQFSLGGSPVGTTTAATLDTTIESSGTKHVAFDLTAGTIALYQCCSLLSTNVQAGDTYDVAGVPPGTVVTLTAMLTVDGAVSTVGCGGSGCGGTFIDRIQSGSLVDGRTHSIGVFNGSVPFHDDLSIPVTIVAGTPTRIDFHFEGYRNPGGSHASEGTGVLRFAGIPAGAAVISCQGYNSSASLPTPTRPASWGRLKVIYR